METICMEDLLPIVAKLTEKYTSFDSTSVTYEKARQLMGAVLYCIEEAKKTPSDVTEEAADSTELMAGEAQSAALLYERGRLLVLDKVQAAKKLFEGLAADFEHYGVLCCAETILQGMPAFFQNYDVRYHPQEHLLTLDYPLIGELGEICGIDRIFAYLECVAMEQKFLQKFPDIYVTRVLRHVYGSYKELLINPCQEMLRNMILRLMVRELTSAGTEAGAAPAPLEKLQMWILEMDAAMLEEKLAGYIQILAEPFEGAANDMAEYLSGDIKNFRAELKNAAEYGTLNKIFISEF